MTITQKAPATRESYDWNLLAEAAISAAGKWVCEDGPRPKTTAHSIRRGTPRAFDPPGSFEAIDRKDGLYVRYIGVPITPWNQWEEGHRPLADEERTFDPAFFPPETATATVDRALRLTPEKVIKKKRARRKGELALDS